MTTIMVVGSCRRPMSSNSNVETLSPAVAKLVSVLEEYRKHKYALLVPVVLYSFLLGNV
jgi:hypothetical protein